MTRRDNRQSAIIVNVVDMEKKMASLYEENKSKLDAKVIGLDTNAPKWGYIETPKGLYLIDYEACGPGGCEDALTDLGNEIDLPLYRKMDGAFDMASTMSIKIDAGFVRGLDKIGEENFADFVRTFGDRLESNFSNWNRHLEREIAQGTVA